MTQVTHERYTAYHADTVEVAASLPDESVDFSIFSPPFASLYVYSNSNRDIGNVRSYSEFADHMAFLIPHQFRVMAPGRLIAIHCMPIPTTMQNDGYIGLQDFRGDLVRMYRAAGFIYHSEVCIWKDPVTQMQRTHALGLLHKQVKKDSARSRQGLADYMVIMGKPGKNLKPIEHTDQDLPVSRWQKLASPVWLDIDQSDTLQYRSAREEEDERHICPLQLEPIRRCVELWSRPDDVVWSPFMGIGSEGVISLEMGRRFIGAELKESYYKQAVKNLSEAANVKQHALFAEGV